MANLSEIIARKNQNDEQWKAQKQAERENAAAMQDAGMEEISSSPEAYARYLEIQGENPLYSAGNIALAMVQNPDITQFGTVERWKTLGRNVQESERRKGVQIFSRASFGKGYSLVPAYDISQTTGREIKRPVLQDDSPAMDSALSTLLNYSIVPVVVDTELNAPAFYDEGKLELAINPNYPDGEAFAAIAAEVAHSRFHAKGQMPSIAVLKVSWTPRAYPTSSVNALESSASCRIFPACPSFTAAGRPRRCGRRWTLCRT